MAGQISGAVPSLVEAMRRPLVLMFVEMLVVSLIWLVAFAAIGVALAFQIGGHGGGEVANIALFFGAFGAVGEVAYLIVERTWGRPNVPRLLLVAAWTLVAPTVTYSALEIARQHTNITTGVFVVLSASILPVVVVALLAYVASWRFRRQRKGFTTDS